MSRDFYRRAILLSHAKLHLKSDNRLLSYCKNDYRYGACRPSWIFKIFTCGHDCHRVSKVKVKVKEADLYSAFIVIPHTRGAQIRITQCYLQITPYLPLPRKHSPDGASPDWGCVHLIAAYYSFIYPERMKGWVGLVGWPTADGLPT